MDRIKEELEKQTELLERLVKLAEESQKSTDYQLRRMATRLEEMSE